MRTASAVEVAATRSALRQALAQEARALGGGLGMREHRARPPRASSSRRGEQVVVDRVDHLGRDPDAVGLAGQRVERGGHAALERVLDRDHGALGLALLDGHHGLVDGGARLGRHRLGGRGQQRLLGVGAGGPQERDAQRHGRSGARRGGPARERGVHGLLLLGRELQLATRPPRSASRTRGRSRGGGSTTSRPRTGGRPAARSSWTGGRTSRRRRRSGPATR